MAYLSVPSPGKLILDIFGKNIFRQFFGTRRQNPDLKVLNPDLFMTELPCHQLGAKIKWVILTFRPGSTYQHQKNKFIVDVEKGTSFWALFLLCCRWFFLFRKKTISGKKRPLKRVIFRSFLSRCPNVAFLGGEGEVDDNDTTTTTRRCDKSEITWPLPHHTQGPNTSWGTPSLWFPSLVYSRPPTPITKMNQKILSANACIIKLS